MDCCTGFELSIEGINDRVESFDSLRELSSYVDDHCDDWMFSRWIVNKEGYIAADITCVADGGNYRYGSAMEFVPGTKRR